MDAEKSNAAYSNDEVTSPQSITLDTQHGQAVYNNQQNSAASAAAPTQGQDSTQGVPPAYPQHEGQYPQQGYAQPPQPGYPQPYGQPQPYGYPQQAPYPQQQGVYYTQQQMVGATVVMQGQPVGVSEEQSGGRTNDCLICSIINCIFCNFLIGIIAIIFSVKARDDFNAGRMASGRSNANVAKGLNICMPIVSVVTAGIVCIYFFAIVGVFSRSYTGYYDSYDSGSSYNSYSDL